MQPAILSCSPTIRYLKSEKSLSIEHTAPSTNMVQSAALLSKEACLKSLKKLERNLLHCTDNDDKITMSTEDKQAHEHYKFTL